VATERLAIELLGAFRVAVESRAIDEREWTLRKVKSLVKLLALAPHHRLHREHIMDRLWPDMGPEDGSNNWPRTVSTVSGRRTKRTPRWLLALCLAGLLLTETIARAHIAAASRLVCAPQLSAAQHGPLPPSPTHRHVASGVPHVPCRPGRSAGRGATGCFSPPRVWFHAPTRARAPPHQAPLLSSHSTI
jgi:hypothetical protein